jgi:hypothetical protein
MRAAVSETLVACSYTSRISLPVFIAKTGRSVLGAALLDRDDLGQVAWLVDVAAPQAGDVVGEEL